MNKLEQDRMLSSEAQLVSAALSLGAETVAGLSSAERRLANRSRSRLDTATAEWFQRYIRRGNDPLGETFCVLRTPEARRPTGAVYTPTEIVRAMTQWAKARDLKPERVIDPGVGSARFLIAAAKVFPKAELVGVDTDPLATLLARANLAAHGLAQRSVILLDDYRTVKLPPIEGRTLFIGNPPYVRHHVLDGFSKRWLTEEARKLGYSASQLSGLHVHFFLATLLHARPGDLGCLVTSAEWLDVNYGKLVRDLFVRDLGGQGLALIDPTAAPFGETATTAVISTFEVGSSSPKVVVKRAADIASMARLDEGTEVDRDILRREARWSRLSASSPKPPPGYVQLGELFRVHRGQVTGANHVWIAGADSNHLPASVLFRAVTRAKELFAAGPILRDSSGLREVIDLPADLSVLTEDERLDVKAFLRRAKAAGVHRGYIAANRRAWWSVGLREPAPILATYMARRPPAFVRNRAGARHINVAHGLYPIEAFPEEVLVAVVSFLNRSTGLTGGRTYAGGLTKFEPKEMERIPVPLPNILLQQSA